MGKQPGTVGLRSTAHGASFCRRYRILGKQFGLSHGKPQRFMEKKLHTQSGSVGTVDPARGGSDRR